MELLKGRTKPLATKFGGFRKWPSPLNSVPELVITSEHPRNLPIAVREKLNIPEPDPFGRQFEADIMHRTYTEMELLPYDVHKPIYRPIAPNGNLNPLAFDWLPMPYAGPVFGEDE